jgi:hypothetical protein
MKTGPEAPEVTAVTDLPTKHPPLPESRRLQLLRAALDAQNAALEEAAKPVREHSSTVFQVDTHLLDAIADASQIYRKGALDVLVMTRC